LKVKWPCTAFTVIIVNSLWARRSRSDLQAIIWGILL